MVRGTLVLTLAFRHSGRDIISTGMLTGIRFPPLEWGGVAGDHAAALEAAACTIAIIGDIGC